MGYFSAIKIQLVDFKIEFGRLYKNDEVYVVLADEISPDSCRLWDSQTKQKMDKDVYRENSGYLLDGYNEVAKRMGLLTQNGASKNKKPTLVKGDNMRAIVYIRLKTEVLDPQGQAIESALRNLGENNINNIRQGKLIEMDIEAKNTEEAEEKIEKITKSLLANTVIEEYSIEIS